MKLRCAVLDDYQGVALGPADWSRVRATSFREHFTSADELVAAIHDCEIVVVVGALVLIARGQQSR